jgi:hypothetical protein
MRHGRREVVRYHIYFLLRFHVSLGDTRFRRQVFSTGASDTLSCIPWECERGARSPASLYHNIGSNWLEAVDVRENLR